MGASTILPETETGKAQPLKVLIVGSGIGGLTAAIGLRDQGHHVELYEQSSLSQETGAAIHLAPNCNGLLRRYGIIPEDFEAVDMMGLAVYSPDGALRNLQNTGATSHLWKHPWQLVHRQHLHTALKNRALNEEYAGEPAKLNTGVRVNSVDPEEASITLTDGSVIRGDLVIGADGVNSRTRHSVPGASVKPFDSGKSAFRFLTPTDQLANDPQTAEFVSKPGHLIMWIGEDRRLVMYPCMAGKMMNFVAIHPSAASADQSEKTGGELKPHFTLPHMDGRTIVMLPLRADWQGLGSKAKMLDIYSSFGPSVAAVLQKTDESKLKVWTLLDMESVDAFAYSKLAILGDAAHPFLPHQGQGGAQAMEDAVSIAAMLPLGTEPKEIPERLKLYETCRYERSHKIQEFTRVAGLDASELAAQGKKLDMMEFTMYNFGHDEWDASSQALTRHLAGSSTAHRYRIPLSFGPSPGPRQPLNSLLHDPRIGHARKQRPEHSITRSIRFRTSRTFLEGLLPAGFAFDSPATVARASISCTTLSDMTWLGGGGYSHLGLYIHGVHYKKRDGSKVHGTFLPILFENLADPIITGREELGMPKVYADIDVQSAERNCSITLSSRGEKFGQLEWSDLQREDQAANSTAAPTRGPGPPPPKDEGLLVYRYVPSVGEPGKADAEYPVLCPRPEANLESETPEPETITTQSASVKLQAGSWETLPTLHNIAKVLAEIPVYGIEEAKSVSADGVDDLSGTRRIE